MRKKVLQVLTSLSGGGVGSVIMNYYSFIKKDFVFDFVVNSRKNTAFEQQVIDDGGFIYEIPSIKKGFFKYISSIKKTMKQTDATIVHCNIGEKSLFYLFYAKKYGIKKRILHVHQTNVPNNFFKKIIFNFLKALCFHYATDFFACGEVAAEIFYKKKKNVFVLKNAIDLDKYMFEPTIRKTERNKMNIKDSIVIGNVGRLSYLKNHDFMIEIFKEIKRMESNTFLVLVGIGELEKQLKEKVQKLGLADSVLFLGLRNDVPKIMNSFDIFLMPSLFEGVPVAAIEALANGLTVVCSSTITKEIEIQNKVFYFSLENTAKQWADFILNLPLSRTNVINELTNKGYSIVEEANDLTKRYLE